MLCVGRETACLSSFCGDQLRVIKTILFRCIAACVAVAFFSLPSICTNVPPLALKSPKDDTIGVTNWLVVPVFYTTNRQYIGSEGAIAYAEDPSSSGVSFGVKNVIVPAPTAASITADKLKKMCWQDLTCAEADAGKQPTFSPEQCQLKNQILSKEGLVKSLRAYSTASGVHDSVVFAHGCCATFDTSMRRAAKIAANMGSAVVLYDWVSPVGFNKYLQNETRLEQTIDDFCLFLNNMEKVTSPRNITLLGHSMGAEFVDQAMVRRAIKNAYVKCKPFREIIMSNADIDARSFLNHSAAFAGNASAVRIYISTDDDRLNASSLAHGSFVRLGAPGPLLSELAQAKNLTVVDITAGDSGHEIPFSVVTALHTGKGASLAKGFTLEKREPGYFCLTKIGGTASAAGKPDLTKEQPAGTK